MARKQGPCVPFLPGLLCHELVLTCQESSNIGFLCQGRGPPILQIACRAAKTPFPILRCVMEQPTLSVTGPSARCLMLRAVVRNPLHHLLLACLSLLLVDLVAPHSRTSHCPIVPCCEDCSLCMCYPCAVFWSTTTLYFLCALPSPSALVLYNTLPGSPRSTLYRVSPQRPGLFTESLFFQ